MAGIVVGPPPRREQKPPPLSCPQCGARTVVPVMYGYPSGDMFEAEQAGEVILGGCVVRAGLPAWKCTSCDTTDSLD
jgi:hypothetical protein